MYLFSTALGALTIYILICVVNVITIKSKLTWGDHSRVLKVGDLFKEWYYQGHSAVFPEPNLEPRSSES